MKTILFFGDSLTSGHGLPNADLAYPGLIQLKINSLNLPYRVVNAGLSGEITAEGKQRIESLLNNKIDVFVLELGANDGIRGLPIVNIYENLQSIIDKVRQAWPDCKMLLTGMLVHPMIMGQGYFESFRAIFPKLAEKNNMAFVPFLLENVATIRELNQADGVHPTEEGQKIMAENVWKILKPMLSGRS